MKIFIATGLVLATMTTATLAQQPPAPPSAPAASSPDQPRPPLSVVPEVMNAPGDTGSAPRQDPPPPPGPDEDAARGHRSHRPPPPPMSKAAHYRIEDGKTKIDIKCADDQPTKECADLLLQVIDKLSGSSSDSRDDDRY